MTDYGYIRENHRRITEAVAEIASRAGRPAPTLVAVTKSATDEEVRFLVEECGQRVIAENRTALFNARYALFADDIRPQMHLIGSLQTNKVRTVIGKPALVQSVDSLRLAEELSRRSEKLGCVTPILLEVNSAGEEAKGGALPEEAEALAEALTRLPAISLRGVMTMGPVLEDEEGYRPYFRLTRELLDQLRQKGLIVGDGILSMGMSHSYRVAIQEGATMVRVGRGLFQQ